MKNLTFDFWVLLVGIGLCSALFIGNKDGMATTTNSITNEITNSITNEEIPAGIDINLVAQDKNLNGPVTANTKVVSLAATVTNHTGNTYSSIVLTPLNVRIANFPQNALADTTYQLDGPQSGGGYDTNGYSAIYPSSRHLYDVAGNYGVTLKNVLAKYSIVATVDFNVKLFMGASNTPVASYTTEIQDIIKD